MASYEMFDDSISCRFEQWRTPFDPHLTGLKFEYCVKLPATTGLWQAKTAHFNPIWTTFG